MIIKLNIFQKVLFWFFVGLIGFWVVIQIQGTKDSFNNYLYSFLFGLMPLVAGIISMWRSGVWGSFKSAVGKALFFIGLGIFLWGVGETIWSYYNFFLGIPAPYPSLAEIGFAPSIFFYSLGTIFLSKATGAKFGLRSKTAKAFLIVSPFIILIAAYYLLVVVARGGVLVPPGETPLKLFLDIVYPLGGFVGITVAVIVSGLSFKYLGGVYRFDIYSLFLGLFGMFVSDVIFSYTTTVGTYYNSNLGDLIFGISWFLISFGVLGFYNLKEKDLPFYTSDLKKYKQVSTSSMIIFDKILSRIIKEQELIIGPMAWEEVKKISFINVIDPIVGKVSFSGDQGGAVETIDYLVSRYKRLFGRASHEVCKEAVQDLIVELPSEEVPQSLKS